MAGLAIIAIHSRQSDLLLNMSQLWVGIVTSLSISPYSIVQMFGPDASRQWNPSFSGDLSDPNVVLITGLGHGSIDQFAGFKGEVLYSSDPAFPIPSSEIANKIVHLLSCSTATGLSVTFLNAGCTAFIGYNQDVPIRQDSTAWLAALLKCDAQIEFSLAKGATVTQAVADAKSQFNLNGLNDIGDLLVSTPQNSAAIIRRSDSVSSSSLTGNSIDGRSTAPANIIAVRTM